MLQVLAWCERSSVVIQERWEVLKQALRHWLGPEPQQFYLLADGHVLPTTMEIPESLHATTYIFDPHTNHMVLASNPAPEGRFRRLPYVALSVQDEIVGNIDLTEWIGELRANPVPSDMPVKQLLTVWSLVHNRYVPLSGGVRVDVVGADGEERVETL